MSCEIDCMGKIIAVVSVTTSQIITKSNVCSTACSYLFYWPFGDGDQQILGERNLVVTGGITKGPDIPKAFPYHDAIMPYPPNPCVLMKIEQHSAWYFESHVLSRARNCRETVNINNQYISIEKIKPIQNVVSHTDERYADISLIVICIRINDSEQYGNVYRALPEVNVALHSTIMTLLEAISS